MLLALSQTVAQSHGLTETFDSDRTAERQPIITAGDARTAGEQLFMYLASGRTHDGQLFDATGTTTTGSGLDT